MSAQIQYFYCENINSLILNIKFIFIVEKAKNSTYKYNFQLALYYFSYIYIKFYHFTFIQFESRPVFIEFFSIVR